MPLEKSASKGAFSENVRREMDAGKPQKQAVAIAYSVQRRARHMDKGGQASSDPLQDAIDLLHAEQDRRQSSDPVQDTIDYLNAEQGQPKQPPKHMAEGGVDLPGSGPNSPDSVTWQDANDPGNYTETWNGTAGQPDISSGSQPVVAPEAKITPGETPIGMDLSGPAPSTWDVGPGAPPHVGPGDTPMGVDMSGPGFGTWSVGPGAAQPEERYAGGVPGVVPLAQFGAMLGKELPIAIPHQGNAVGDAEDLIAKHKAQQAAESALPQSEVDDLKKSGEGESTTAPPAPEGYARAVEAVESAGGTQLKNPNPGSTAKGLYGFTDPTAKRIDAKYHLDPNDPDIENKRLGALTADNAKALGTDDPYKLYAAHNSGVPAVLEAEKKATEAGEPDKWADYLVTPVGKGNKDPTQGRKALAAFRQAYDPEGGGAGLPGQVQRMAEGATAPGPVDVKTKGFQEPQFTPEAPQTADQKRGLELVKSGAVPQLSGGIGDALTNLGGEMAPPVPQAGPPAPAQQVVTPDGLQRVNEALNPKQQHQALLDEAGKIAQGGGQPQPPDVPTTLEGNAQAQFAQGQSDEQKAMAAQQASFHQSANAEGQEGKQEADVLKRGAQDMGWQAAENQEDMQRAMDDVVRRTNAAQASYQQIRDRVMNEKLDPGRWWASRSDGQKAAGIIGALVSGLSGSDHNAALDMINGMVNKDVDLQKSKLESNTRMAMEEGNLYGHMLEAYRGLPDVQLRAQEAARSALLSQVSANLARIGALSKDPQAQARANLLSAVTAQNAGALEQKNATAPMQIAASGVGLAQQWHNLQAMRGIGAMIQGITPQTLEQQQERAAALGDAFASGKYVEGGSGPTRFRGILMGDKPSDQERQRLQALDDSERFRQEIDDRLKSGYFFNPEHRAEMASLAGQMQERYLQAMGSAPRPGESAKDFADSIISSKPADLSTMWEGRSRAIRFGVPNQRLSILRAHHFIPLR